jgi:adenylate cyclase
VGIEIERKFLVSREQLVRISFTESRNLTQAYLSKARGRTVRVRIDHDLAFLTVKGPAADLVRPEFEYSIPMQDAHNMLALCEKPWIEKTRHLVDYAGLTWEVDEFHGENQGLVVAEVELDSADQAIELPDWLGPEVSNETRYHNSRLADRPFNQWTEAERAWPTLEEPAGKLGSDSVDEVSPSPYCLLVELYVREGKEQLFEEYEQNVLSLLHDHGIVLLSRLRCQNNKASPELPFETHILQVPSASAWTQFEQDPRRTELSALRDLALLRTVTHQMQQLP